MRARGVLLAFLVLAPAAAQDAGPSGRAQVLTNQFGGWVRGSPRGSMQQVEVFFREGAVRVQFHDAAGAGYALIVPAGSGNAWIQGQAGGLRPVPGVQWPLRFDPAQPCTGQGLFAQCQAKDSGLYAGREARHWAYRFGASRGPGGTREGQMWLDAETGLVLEYTGHSGLERDVRWQVQKIEFGPVEPSLFEPEPATDSPGN